MGRLIDVDKLKDILEYAILANVSADDANTKEEKWNDWIQSVIDTAPTVEAILKEEVRQFIENIQKIKDNHNEHGEPINYGTICGILIEGYRLLDKYRKGKDGNEDKTLCRNIYCKRF